MMKASCPICEKVMEGESAADWPCYPFCSERCKLIDLGRWLGEAYRLPAAAPEESPVDVEDESPNP